MLFTRSAFLLALMLAPTVAAAQDTLAITRCHNRTSTMEIVECLDRLTTQADQRLNIAYQRLLKTVDPSGVPALRAAERAWLEYRKQRCSYVSAVQGSIAQIIGVDCMMRMTKSRADELEEDGKGLGPG